MAARSTEWLEGGPYHPYLQEEFDRRLKQLPAYLSPLGDIQTLLRLYRATNYFGGERE
jgi:hypothetical protein